MTLAPGVPATLFAPTLPGAGVSVRLRFIGDVLVVEGPHAQRIGADQLRARSGGADDDALFLDWQADGQRCSAMLVDRVAQQQLVVDAPPALQPQLRRWQRRVVVQHAKWNAVLGSTAVLLLGFVLFIWQSERVAGWLAARVPVSTEQSLGESGLKQIKLQSRLTQEGPAAEALQAIGARITQGSRYSYRWFIKSDDSVNAFAMPGGVVIVHTALIEQTQSAEELAGVLAHEVQHIEQRHSLQQMIHSAGWAAVLMVTLGDVSAFSAILLHQAGNLRHSRRLETAADLAGVQALIKAGISPVGMRSFFERMDRDMPESIALLSSHPLPAERIQQIEQAVRQPCDCPPLAYDWDIIRASATAAR